jgi:serine/threonine protein kinase/tetratricopeptide (TPR) repeat protein
VTPDLQKGTELADRYTLVRKLGTGAHTQTWLATDRMTRASVALKILTGTGISPELLRSEWQTSIRLMHAHIVRVFEFHSDSNSTFYSMQFVDGADCSVLAAAPPNDILQPMALVAAALKYSHDKGVVHRDIKASNILLDKNGAPYLTDFGSAAQSAAAASGGSLIAASPQSLAGEPAQPADDIFALGGLLYELLSGQSPYRPESIADDISNQVPAPVAAASDEKLPAGVVSLVASMLAKDATERPSAAAVVKQLADCGFNGAPAPTRYVANEEVVQAEIIEAATDMRSRKSGAATALSTASDNSGISPRTVGISLAVLVTILLGVVFFLPSTVTDDDAATPEAASNTAADTPTTVPAEPESEPEEDLPERDGRVVARSEADQVLGQLLSMMNTLERRAVQRWGGLRFKQAQEVYAEADAAYLARDWATASDKYRETIAALEPLLEEVDQVFAQHYNDAQTALQAANTLDALRLFEMAVAISPSHAGAQAGLARARNLDTVLVLTERGMTFERDLELVAAQEAYKQAVELDPEWQPAREGLDRVSEVITRSEFDQRMTEGLIAISDGHYDAARAAFRMAQELEPASREPADGLLQVEQEIRLNQISAYEQQVLQQEEDEEWPAAVATYDKILEIDDNLEFAQQGKQHARQLTLLHEELDTYIEEPDSLSSPSTMQKATMRVVDITRMSDVGPSLSAKRDELSRLLKRAATPLQVQLVSDNATDVSVYKVGKLGSFETHELTLRPGKYVAVGSRPGYRDVRLEFLVGPEQEAKPIVIRCEEAI